MAPKVPIKRGLAQLQKVRWEVVLAIAVRVIEEGRRRWSHLSEYEQRELTRMARKSKGRPGNLTARERAEFRRIVAKAMSGG